MSRDAADYEELDARRGELAAQGAASRDAAAGNDWPGYRGGDRAGVADETIAVDWTSGPPERVWSVRVGPGYGSMAIGGGLVVTMEQRREREAVVAFSLADGALAWEHAWDARFHEALSKEGPRATPVIERGRVVALGATGELRCVGLADGELQWRRSLMDDSVPNLEYGLAASPVARNGVVVAQGSRTVLALDVETGDVRWRALDETLAYATPTIGRLDGRDVVVVTTAERVVGLALGTGDELWSFDFRVRSGNACTQPILPGGDRVIVSAGYGAGSRAVRIVDGAVVEEWTSRRFKSRFSEPVMIDGLLFGLDEGTLCCVDPSDGRRSWKEGRYGNSQVVAFGDRVVLTQDDGVARVVEVSADGAIERGEFRALDSELQLNLTAATRGLWLVRNHVELACFRLAGAAEISANGD